MNPEKLESFSKSSFSRIKEELKNGNLLFLELEHIIREVPPGVQVVMFLSTVDGLDKVQTSVRCETRLITPGQYRKISQLSNGPGFGLLIETPRTWKSGLDGLPAGKKVVVFYGVQIPENVGSVIRSASALGIRLVILDDHSVRPTNSKLIRSSGGVILSSEVYRCGRGELLELIRGSEGNWVVPSLETDREIRDTTLSPSAISGYIVNGEKGRDEELLRSARVVPVKIPMEGGVDSLNTAVAFSLTAWYFERISPSLR